MKNVLHINLNSIKESPYQGRLINPADTSDEKSLLAGLKNSIQSSGLMQPVVLRAVDGGYELIDGHRRVEACRQLGWETIEAIVNEYSDKEAQVMSVVANLQRTDLKNIEKAIAFKKVLDQGIFKDKRELSKAIGKDETFVGDMINAANMDQRIIDDLLKNKTTNDVRLLRSIRRVEKVDENQVSEKQWELYQRFINENLSRFEIQKLSKTTKEGPEKSYSVTRTAHKIHIELHNKLPKDKREMIQKMLEEKMEEIMKLV